MEKPYTLYQLLNDWKKMNKECSSYRLGQHFINMLIKDSSSEEMQNLWNEDCVLKANVIIYDIVDRYGWDLNDLPLLEHVKNKGGL